MTNLALGYAIDHEIRGQRVGVGADSNETFKRFLEIIFKNYLAPISRQDANIFEKFHNFKLSWQQDTKYASFDIEIVSHPSYLGIIRMGDAVIPLILAELKKQPHQWFSALNAITGEDPIEPEQWGKSREMIEAWLDWGKRNDYID